MARPKKYQREEVVNQALDVFWRKGYAATSLTDLTDATGLNKRSLYNEFGNKEGLFLETLARYRALRAPAAAILKQSPQGLHNIIALYRAMADNIDDRGCLLALCLNERELLSEMASGVVNDALSGMKQLIADNLAADQWPDTIDLDALTNLLSLQSLTITAMGKSEMPRETIEATVEQLIRILPKPLPR